MLSLPIRFATRGAGRGFGALFGAAFRAVLGAVFGAALGALGALAGREVLAGMIWRNKSSTELPYGSRLSASVRPAKPGCDLCHSSVVTPAVIFRSIY